MVRQFELVNVNVVLSSSDAMSLDYDKPLGLPFTVL